MCGIFLFLDLLYENQILMDINNKYIAAPIIDAKKLWEMNADDFNSWRKINDYPRIVSFFKEKLPLATPRAGKKLSCSCDIISSF